MASDFPLITTRATVREREREREREGDLSEIKIKSYKQKNRLFIITEIIRNWDF